MKKHFALIGAPNSGKTTLYNWLTGSKFKTVNYPGATVEYARGVLAPHLAGDADLVLIDTPGIYSLLPKSLDEEVTLKALFQLPDVGPVNGVVVVVDGTQLDRHLHLALQVKEAGFPFLVVVTMADLLRREGLEFDFDALSAELGAKVIPFEGLLGGGLQALVQGITALPSAGSVRPPTKDLTEIHARAAAIARRVSSRVENAGVRLRRLSEATRSLDRWLLHPVLGPFLFFAIMTTLFASIFWFAQPFADGIDGGFSFLANKVAGEGEPGVLRDFLAHGLIASFGAIFVFIPQIFILFFGIGLLESTGYLARAATLIDRPFSKVGLTGRSFVPILSGFSCAVPAIIATRNISSARDRWITNFVIPLMTCSARLPVYALLLTFLFQGEAPWKAGFVLALLYFGALVLGGFAAGVLNRIIPKDAASILLMELPLYRQPRFRVVLHQSLVRTKGYIFRAGPVILVIAVGLWFASNFPNYEMADASQKLETSYAGRAGHWLEPIVAPMGADWRVGVGLLSAFAAREVFVSTLAVTFNIASDDDDTQRESLLKQMETATRASDGAKIFTTANVTGLILFFMIALQCMSTFAVAQRESGSWRFAVAQLVLFNVFAYGIAVAVVQSLHVFGVA